MTNLDDLCFGAKAPEPEEPQRFFLEELVQEIQTSAELMIAPDNFLTKVKLLEAANNFHRHYSHAPHELYLYMRRCLAMEMEVIQGTGAQLMAQPQTERKYSELLTGLQTVRQKVNVVSEDIRTLQGSIESFSLQYHECLKNKGHINYLQQSGPMTNERRELEACLRVQIEEMERKLNVLVAQINQSQMTLVDHMKENIGMLGQLQAQVLDEELIKWKREQQLSGNGVPMQSNLNNIQEWCELLAEMIWTSRQQVNNVARINSKTIVELRQPHLIEMLEDLGKQVTSLLSTLVTSTFVIEKQPPQVMKTNTRFTATVRLLVGGQLNVYMTPPRVSVIIISEQQAQQLLKSECTATTSRGKPPQECGDILNNTGTMEYQPASRQLSVSFRNMQLRKIKRAEKKGTESVMDEKLTLLFQSEFNVGGGELVFQVWTLSLPVVVIVHGNQEPHGWATVTWDNAFSPPGRVPFAVPDKVTWGQLAETLRIKFLSATGGDLSEDNLRFLAEKIFRSNVPLSALELNGMTVSWTQFCKDALPDRNFTFWEWFYMLLKMTRDCSQLRDMWRDRLIMGFIQKKQAEDMLSKCPPGTFLLRFSDSELGGITIAWTGEGNEVFSLQPFTSRDLSLRSLADRISDLGQLQFLYPSTPKDDVFAKFYSKQETASTNGYVRPGLVTTLPPYISPSPAYSAHSPDSHRNTPSVQSSYMSPTPMQEQTFIDADILDQIRAINPENFDEFDDFYTGTTMNFD
ncbi:signal transducer and activator of transcription 5B isoform X2 [Hyposmocoma kahamanoa]|uniref:signal transducer and activator of transcription 5B isoform X2 n=1 Tax=Hyposmocoma kahamanoa TaxID=1477025 RepID=UPI000E6D8EF7|nr:signal transducer and activator of transcription 5B isoform X2 [Hyposmocoma kahamanoa]